MVLNGMAALRGCREGYRGYNVFYCDSYKPKITAGRPQELRQRPGPPHTHTIREPFGSTHGYAMHASPPAPPAQSTCCTMSVLDASQPLGAFLTPPHAPRLYRPAPPGAHQTAAREPRFANRVPFMQGQGMDGVGWGKWVGAGRAYCHIIHGQ